MRYVMILMLAVTIGMACSGVASARGEKSSHKEKVVRLLTVGNSFSGNATRYLDELVTAAGHKLVLGRADLPGCWLELHWRHAAAAEADPKGEAGRPYPISVGGSEVHRSLKEMLAAIKWDVVTIQQASMISSDISTYRPYARNLRDYIKKNAPQAEVVMHETWAYRCDDPRFDSVADSESKMHHDLRHSYKTIAAELGLRIMPVGDAMYAVDTDKSWCYKPAKFTHVYPDLPDQTHSLHVGYWWQKNEQGNYELQSDTRHANAAGCYLAGCVWFECLYKESVENNSFVPDGISASDAKYLRSMAHKIVQTDKF